MSFTALLVTVGMAAVYALPGYSSEAVAPESVAARGGIASQSLISAAGGASTILRDDYTVTLAPKIRPVNHQSAYASLARTFINNPNSPIQWPFTVGVPISSGFGARTAPCSACSSFHDGIDMTPGSGTPIQAIADGVVREVSTTDRGGLGVYAIIDHSVDGQLVSSLYAHMLAGSLQLRVGQSVRVGQQVGNVGNTGISTGAHLHLSILLGGTWPTDPFAWLSAHVIPG